MNTLQRSYYAVKAGIVAAYEATKATFTGSRDTSFWGTWRTSMWRWGVWGYRRLAELAMTNPHSRRGLQLIAQTMSSVPLQVQQRDGNEWESAEEEGGRVRLFERPNDRMSRYHFFNKIVVALYAGGEFWLEKRGPETGPNAGEVRSLRIIMPDEFGGFIRDTQTQEITGYHFNSRSTGLTYERTTEEVLHVRLFNPIDADRGLPILTAGMSIKQMQAAQEWNTNIAQGGGRVPGYWVPNANAFDTSGGNAPILDRETIQNAQDDFDERSRERAEANLDMFLTGAFERQSGDVSPKDADWIEGQKLAIRQIATLLGVPPTLLGDEQAGSLTDSGVNSEVRALMVLTILPLLEWVLQEVSAFLLPEDLRFYYNRDQIEALQEDVNGMWRRYGDAFALGIIDRDEARQGLGFEAQGSAQEGADQQQQEEPDEEMVNEETAERSVPQLDLNGLLNGTQVSHSMDNLRAAYREKMESHA